MLDLDSLAEKCAQDLNEKQENWRNVIWGADFQMLAKNMSDGEVETLVKACRSLVQLQDVVRHLVNHSRLPSGESPFAVLQSEARAKGVNLSDWIASLGKN